MATIDRFDSDAYEVKIGTADIAGIANAIKTVPDEFINEAGNGVTEAGLAYLKPLIVGEIPTVYENGLPKHIII